MRSASASPSRWKFAWRAVFGGRQKCTERFMTIIAKRDRGQSFKLLALTVHRCEENVSPPTGLMETF